MAFATKKVGPSQAPLPKGKNKPETKSNDPSGQGGKKGGYPNGMPHKPGKATKKP